MGKKVLLIDDDRELGRLVEAILRPLEVTLYQTYSGNDGLHKAYEIHPDLIILDVMMPGMDGFDVCARLREMANVPVLMLTARTNENDMLRAFNSGVDDFVRKPFNRNELEARVRALLRRSNNGNHHAQNSYITSYRDDILEVDLSAQTVRLRGQIVELTPREYEVLACLVREQGRIVSHNELVREVWGEPTINGPSVTSLYIYYLRKKIEDGQHGHHYLHTHWGRGYWFEPKLDPQT
jgi:two-component system, OmpR family, response regulator VicR